MSGSTAVTGSLGKAVVAGILITRLTMWRLNVSTSETAWGDSESAGYTNRKAARIDGTGSIGGKYESTKKWYAVFLPGDIVTLALWNTTSAADYWAFPSALIQSVDYEVNPDSKEVIAWSANFGADGIFYAPGQAGAPTYSLPSS